MPRIPFVPADLSEPADVVAAIRARRGGELLHIDRMLLNSPALASGWNGYLRAVRNDIGLDPMLRELARTCAEATFSATHVLQTRCSRSVSKPKASMARAASVA